MATSVEVERIAVPHGLSVTTAKLIEKMKGGKPGDTLTDDELTEACGKNTKVTGDGYSNLQTAIRYCVNNHGIFWQRITGAWMLKCLTASETLMTGSSQLKRISRRARRTVKQLRTINVAELPNGEAPKFNTLVAQCTSLAMFASTDATKKLEARGLTQPIDMGKLLEAMK